MQTDPSLTLYKLNPPDMIVHHMDREYVLKVCDLPQEEKPRERLIAYGPEVLSVSDLLAVVINVGTRKEGVLEMSARILKEYGGRSIIYETNPKKLSEELDIPMTKSCQIIACFELGRRYFRPATNGTTVIRTPRQAYDYVKDMRELPKEHLRGLYLNSHYQVIHDEVISIGSLTSNIIHPREVFKPAIAISAIGVVLAHNHPSGVSEPSADDLAITRQLIEAGKILGVALLDHIIVTKDMFTCIPIWDAQLSK
jgi:DNA repair protein RadC